MCQVDSSLVEVVVEAPEVITVLHPPMDLQNKVTDLLNPAMDHQLKPNRLTQHLLSQAILPQLRTLMVMDHLQHL